MPAKSKLIYQCTQCGYESPKWTGKCPECGEWNTMLEMLKEPMTQKSTAASSAGNVSRPIGIHEISTADEPRYHTGLGELDRVLGGGIVKGLYAYARSPRNRKVYAALQICEYLGQNLKILYVSGEESARQIKLRASRLGVQSPNMKF